MSVSYFNTNEYELMNKDNIVATEAVQEMNLMTYILKFIIYFHNYQLVSKHLKTGSKIVEHLAIASTLKNCLSVATVMI